MKESIFPTNGPKPVAPYSPGMRANGFIFLSGQIPSDPDTGELVTGDIQAQCARVIANFTIVLAAAGLTLDDLVKTTLSFTDMNNNAKMNEEYGKFFPNNPPART